jgi:hypothetical protein
MSLKIMIPGALILLAAYLIGSFVAATFDITAWAISHRVLTALFGTAIAGFITVGVAIDEYTRGG